ncbi:restriction endonuclease subunit S [Burkholderia multivorans]|uniref:restriction endonuclease subunit S n=1 Tax=Burkholderia multivorans TaxID=87883 RepID=UPI000CFFF92E|nr:restriction endonuclease subunit S [Burkholderia multivorans]PRE03194.1 hypothetical protein C6P91_19775 [Burkholderia multivorans]
MSTLPQGWSRATLGNLVQFTYGKALPSHARSGTGFPVFGSNGVVGFHETPLTKGPTIIVGRKGSVGEVHFSTDPCSPIDTTYYIDQFYGMPERYWFHLLKMLNLGNLNKSTAIPGLNRDDAYRLEISVPPLLEQSRIAERLDAVLARVDSARTKLERVPLLLKRFRQAVLGSVYIR